MANQSHPEFMQIEHAVYSEDCGKRHYQTTDNQKNNSI